MREKRKKEIKNRKNFLPSILVALALWAVTASIIFLFDPDFFGSVILFFILLFSSLVFTLSLLLADTKRGIIASTGITLFLILRYFGIGNLLNGILIAGATLATEIYFWYSGDQK